MIILKILLPLLFLQLKHFILQWVFLMFYKTNMLITHTVNLSKNKRDNLTLALQNYKISGIIDTLTTNAIFCLISTWIWGQSIKIKTTWRLQKLQSSLRFRALNI